MHALKPCLALVLPALVPGCASRAVVSQSTEGDDDGESGDASGSVADGTTTGGDTSSDPNACTWHRRSSGAPALKDVWGANGTSFAVGTDAHAWLARRDARGWTALETPVDGFSRVWASGPERVVVTGGSRVGGWDGSHWETLLEVPPEGAFITLFTDVWGTEAGELLVAGYKTTCCHSPVVREDVLWHFDGAVWSETMLPGPVVALWGSDITRVFAVGPGGGMLEFDGEHWSAIELPTAPDLLAVSGIAPSDVIAVGTGGAAVRFDGTSWSAIPAATDLDLHAVWMRSPAEAFALGASFESGDPVAGSSRVLRWNGSEWSFMGVEPRGVVHALSGDETALTLVGGDSGLLVQRIESRTLHEDWRVDDLGTVWAMWAGPDGRALAVGAVLARGHREDWHAIRALPWQASGVWASSTEDVWITVFPPNSSVSPLYHFDGAELEPVTVPGADNLHLTAVWGSGPTDVWVGGRGYRLDGGVETSPTRLLHFDGAQWIDAPVDSDSEIRAIHGVDGHVFAVGNDIFRHDGSAWSSLEMPSLDGYASVWAAARDEVWVVHGDRLLRYDGVGWAQVNELPPVVGSSILGLARDDVYLSGLEAFGDERWPSYRNVLWHYDGTQWSPLDETPEAGQLVAGGDQLYLNSSQSLWWRTCPD